MQLLIASLSSISLHRALRGFVIFLVAAVTLSGGIVLTAQADSRHAVALDHDFHVHAGPCIGQAPYVLPDYSPGGAVCRVYNQYNDIDADGDLICVRQIHCDGGEVVSPPCGQELDF